MLFPERPALHDLSGQTHSHLASITLNWLVKGGRREDTRTVSVSLRQAWREREKKKKTFNLSTRSTVMVRSNRVAGTGKPSCGQSLVPEWEDGSLSPWGHVRLQPAPKNISCTRVVFLITLTSSTTFSRN